MHSLHFHPLALLPHLLLLLINHEIIVNSSQWLIIGEDLEHLLANSREDLLAVSSLTHRLVLIEWVFNVNELCIWDVLDKQPLYRNRTRPFAGLLPKLIMPYVSSDSIHHFGNAAEMLRLVDAEHEVHVGVTRRNILLNDISNLLTAALLLTIVVVVAAAAADVVLLFEFAQFKVGFIKDLVAILRRTPNIVFDRLVHIFLRKGFNYEEAGIALVSRLIS